MFSSIHLNVYYNFRLKLQNSSGYALYIALLPLLMMYRVPFINLGLSTALLLVGVAYCVYVTFPNRGSPHFGFARINRTMIPFILFTLYSLSKADVRPALMNLALLMHLLAISRGALNTDKLKHYFIIFSWIAAIAVIVQTVVHRLLGFHIPMIALDFCLDSAKQQYGTFILTGFGSSLSLLYRPCAFFLEPSHMTTYCAIGLLCSLFQEKPDYRRAIVISLGMILSTSGIGMVLTAAIWLLFPLLSKSCTAKKRIFRFFLVLFAGLLAFLILLQFPFFRSALSRLTSPVAYSATQYNAIWGRTLNWNVYIAPMHGRDLWLGYGTAAKPNSYFTALMSLIYYYGIVGTVLYCLSLVYLFVHSRQVEGRLLVAIFIALLPTTNHLDPLLAIHYLALIAALLPSGAVSTGHKEPELSTQDGSCV